MKRRKQPNKLKLFYYSHPYFVIFNLLIIYNIILIGIAALVMTYLMRGVEKDGFTLSKDKKLCLVGYHLTIQKLLAPEGIINTTGLLEDKKYKVGVVELDHNIKDFGGLVNIITPFHVNPNGWLVNVLSKYKTMGGEKDNYTVYGNVLNNGGLILNPEWSASGLNSGVRVMKDFGSRLYVIELDETN